MLKSVSGDIIFFKMVDQIKTVLVLYVGGTIGMEKNDDGVYVPASKKFIDELKRHRRLHDLDVAEAKADIKENELILPLRENIVILYEVKTYDPLLDSSNMTSQEWIKIGKDLEKNYNCFDGFVILHGTDTLAYTSSVLSFMIEGLEKPVIVTGAQVPIFEKRSDAVANILTSLILAGCYNIPEVCVFFGNKLLRGNRSTKLSLTKLEAFDSPNYSPLAETEVQIILNRNYIMESQKTIFRVNTNLNINVAVLTFFPTITSSLIACFLQQPLSGVVMQTYGAGNIPSNQTQIVEILKGAINRGVLIVNVSACIQGSISRMYDTGKILEDIGVVSGYDMTVEAALAKLCVVLGHSDLSYEDKVKMMKTNIRGELTLSNN